MEIYSVGPDEMYLESVEKRGTFEWIVYDYRVDGYEGTGEAVLLGKDGLIYTHYLGHCSCYGPMEEFSMMHGMTIEEFLRPKDSIFDFECKDAVDLKVRELLSRR